MSDAQVFELLVVTGKKLQRNQSSQFFDELRKASH